MRIQELSNIIHFMNFFLQLIIINKFYIIIYYKQYSILLTKAKKPGSACDFNFFYLFPTLKINIHRYMTNNIILLIIYFRMYFQNISKKFSIIKEYNY